MSETTQLHGSAVLVAQAGFWEPLGRPIFLSGFDDAGKTDDSLFGRGAEEEHNAILSAVTHKDVVPLEGRFGPPDWYWVEEMRGWSDDFLWAAFYAALCDVLRTKRIGATIIDNFRSNQRPVFTHDWTNERNDEDPIYLARFAQNSDAARSAAADVRNKVQAALDWRVRSSLSTTVATLDRLFERVDPPHIDFEADWKRLAGWGHFNDILKSGTITGLIERIWNEITNDPGQYDQALVLKAIIGGTQGLHAGMQNVYYSRNASGGIAGLHYDLIFSIYDVFGAGSDDTYSAGLIPFYLLQHERGFRPFKQRLRIAYRNQLLTW